MRPSPSGSTGHCGLGFFRFFQEQNEKIAEGTSAKRRTGYLQLDTLIQTESAISFPHNNLHAGDFQP